MKVLVVDDNEVNRKLLRVTLATEGHKTVEAADGIEALETLLSGGFEAVISDVLMPRMDGYRLCYEVRQSKAVANIPFIIYTSTYTSPSDEQLARKMGADLFLTRPAPAKTILDALERLHVSSAPKARPESPVRELEVLKEYSEALVRKLERKNEELETSERRYRELVAMAPIGIFRSSREGRFVSVNAALANLLGYDSIDEILRLDIRKDLYFDEAERERVIAEIERQGGAGTLEIQLKRRDGSALWVRLDARLIRGDSGASEYFEGFVHDIEQRRRAEEALRQSVERFRRTFSVSPIGMSLSEAKSGRLIDVNQQFAQTFGYRREELIGRTSLEIGLWANPNERDRVTRSVRRAVPVREREVQMRAKNGDLRFVLGSIEPLEFGDETILLSVFQDITDRKRTEADLKRSEERFRSLIENSKDLILILDASASVLYASPSIENMLGFTPQEIVGTNALALVNSEDALKVGARLREIVSQEMPTVPMPFRVRHKSGAWRTFEALGTNRINDPAIGGVVLNARDVTEMKEAEAALRVSEERYRLLFEDNPQPMWVFDEETLSFLAVNEAACRHYGYSRDEFLAMTISDIRPPEDVDRLKHVVESERREYRESGVWRHRKKDGTVIEVEIRSNPIDFGGRQAQLVLALDVTERRQLENQFRQAQKMEAVGQLAGGVAHDFNNLLTAILGYSDLLASEVQGQASLGESVEEIRKAGERAASLTRQLLAFSRRQVLEPKVLDINALVANLEKMLRRLIGEDVELSSSLASDAGRIRADAGQVEQILMNLAVNARDAMPRGGKLTLETANVTLDDAYARTHVAVQPGPYVMLAMTDTGSGMTAETRTHLFEPFFTTKEQGRGTGLGLATVYGIVKQSGGYIWVYSELGKGTVFKIYFPRVEGDVTQAAPSVSAPIRGSATVLLLEDEQAVRTLTRRLLESFGYSVLEAASADEADRLAAAHQGPIDLLLTDVVMPGMGGSEAASRISKTRPGIRVLYMSGYTDDAVVRQGLVADGSHFLQKPFTPQTLAHRVAEVLAAAQPKQ